jgi:hypothetical protein
MKWISDYQSSIRSEVSVLSMVETALAGGIALLLAEKTGTMRPLAVSAILAPFLLLRTANSISAGLRWGQVITDRAYNVLNLIDLSEGTIFPLAMVGVAVIWFISISLITAVKVGVTAYFSMRHPYESLCAIPKNWRKVVFALDCATLPEVLPGIESIDTRQERHSLSLIKVSDLQVEVRNSYRGGIRGKTVAAALVFVALGVFVIAVAYRYSLKSTALIWSPLVWIAGSMSLESGLPRYFHHMIYDSSYRIARIYSALVILLFGGKLYLLVCIERWGAYLNEMPGWTILSYYVAPHALPVWHIAAALNAILSFVLLFIAERHVNYYCSYHVTAQPPLRTDAPPRIALIA